MNTIETTHPEHAVSRRGLLGQFAAAGLAACFSASALAKGSFEFLGACVAFTLTPEFYNCKTGKWGLWYVAHRTGKSETHAPLAAPEPNVKTRVLLKSKVFPFNPIPGVICKLDKRSYQSKDFPWHPYDAKLSDKNGYATFEPIYLSPGITWEFRYSAPGAETVYRIVRV